MTRRGLTLLEVVAATALLTVVVAACLPMLAEARRWSDGRRDPDVLIDLILVADAFAADPEAYGVDPESITAHAFFAEIDSSHSTDAGGIVGVRLLTASGSGHGWLEFTSGGRSVVRFIDLPDPESTSSQEATE